MDEKEKKTRWVGCFNIFKSACNASEYKVIMLTHHRGIRLSSEEDTQCTPCSLEDKSTPQMSVT